MMRNRSFPRQRQRGALTVEYALLMPVTMLVLLFFLEVMRFHAVTILLDNALYNIAYELRISRDRDLPSIATKVLKNGNYYLFDPADVQITVRSGVSIRDLASASIGQPGLGQPGQPILLRLQGSIGLLDALSGVFGAQDASVKTRSVELTLLSLNELE